MDINKKNRIENVMAKTITGDRKLGGKKLSIIGFLRIQIQNPSVGFISIMAIVIIIILSIPIAPKVYEAVQVNEEKK